MHSPLIPTRRRFYRWSALVALFAAGLSFHPGTAAAQEPDWQKSAGGKMAFDVASIRPTKPGEFTPPNFPLSADDSFPSTPIDSFNADFPAVVYITFAYKVTLSKGERDSLVASMPEWAGKDAYEVHAKTDGPATKDQMRLMVQALLADRFKLAAHFETKELPVYALTLIKPGAYGAKLIPHSQGPACDAKVRFDCGTYMLHPTTSGAMLSSRDTTMSLLASSLGTLPGVSLDRPVVDQTGLSGRYDFTLEYVPEKRPTSGATEATPDPEGASIVDSLRDQLGMKLVPAKAKMRVLVVDHIERPSEN